LKKKIYLKDLLEYTQSIINQISFNSIILLEGSLGAGKTTTVQKFGETLHVQEKMVSPTFNLMNEYQTKNLVNVYHIDLYRISGNYFEELESIQEPFIIFIEWYDKISLNWKSWANNNNASLYKLNISIQFEDDIEIDKINSLPREFSWKKIETS